MQHLSFLPVFIQFILLLIFITVLYLAYMFGYCFFIKPYLRVRYFLNQGGVGKFCYGPQFFMENKRNAELYGDSLLPYLETLKQDPNIKFFVRSIGSQALVILADVGMIKQFLQNQQDFDKSRFFKEMNREFEVGLFMAHGETWKHTRKFMSPFFTFEALKRSIPMIVKSTRETYARWIQTGNLQQNAISMFSQVSGEVILKYLFNSDIHTVHTKDGKVITDAILDFLASFMSANDTLTRVLLGSKFVEKGIFAAHKKFVENKKKFIDLAKQLIAQAQKRGVPQEVYLYKLLEAYKLGEAEYDEDRIVADLMNLLIAGTDTNAHNMGYTIYFLAKNSLILEKLLAEIDREILDLDNLDLDTLNRLDYTNSVIKETLRLAHPAPWIFFREALKPQKIGNIDIKPGDLVTTALPLVHFSEKYYSRPMEYIPERWLSDGPFPNDGFKKEPYAYLPFSSGPRNCIGQYLAMIEAKVMLIMFVKAFKFRIPEDYDLKLIAANFNEPVKTMMVTLDPVTKTS